MRQHHHSVTVRQVMVRALLACGAMTCGVVEARQSETTLGDHPFVSLPFQVENVIQGRYLFVNEHGDACGNVDDGTDPGNYLPIFMRDGAITELTLTTGGNTYDFGVARGLNEAVYDSSGHTYSYPLIVGYVWGLSGNNNLKACYWQWNETSDEYDLSLVPGGPTNGYLYAVNNTGIAVGGGTFSGSFRPYTYDILGSGGLSYLDGSDTGSATDINSSGDISGYRFSTGANLLLPWIIRSGQSTSLIPGYTTHLVVNPWQINTGKDAAGYFVDDDDDVCLRKPCYWTYSTGTQTWTFKDLDSFLTGDSEYDSWDAAAAFDINASREVLVARSDTPTCDPGEEPYSGSILYKFTSNPTNAHYIINIPDNITNAPDGSLPYRFVRVNDAGMMAGAFEVNDDPLTLQPGILYPYDMDNNGTPDYRTIMSTSGNDTNEDGILDKYQKFHTGLHAPGRDPNGQATQEINNTQVVRLLYDQYEIHNIVHDVGTACDDAHAAFNEWGHEGGSDGKQKEIIVTIRTVRADHGTCELDDDHDYIPPTTASCTGELTQAEVLADLECFAGEFAHCIDFVQLGNEVLGGPGEYWYVDPEDNESELSEVDPEYYELACEDIYGWLKMQADSVRRGSCLALRPLRLIGPAVTIRQVHVGFDGNLNDPDYDTTADRVALGVWWSIDTANRLNAACDLHLHYEFENATQGNGEPNLETAVSRFVSSSAPWATRSGQGATPVLRTCTEFGPVPTETWMGENRDSNSGHSSANNTNAENLQDMFDGDYDDTSGETWDSYNAEWKTAQYGSTNCSVATAFSYLHANGFRHACWGPTVQSAGGIADKYDCAALRETEVHDDFKDPEGWSSLRAEYQNAAATWVIASFTPHNAACTGSPDDCGCGN